MQLARRSPRVPSLLLALVVVASGAARAQAPLAPEAPGHVVGRVCIDANGDMRCAPDEEGLEGARVFTSDGLVATTDGAGRYHLSDVGSRALASTLSSTVFSRLRYVAVRCDTARLGPGAVAPAAVVVDVVPGVATLVDLPVRPPSWREAPLVAVGGALRVAARADGTVIARVPAHAPLGHAVSVDGVHLTPDEGGGFLVEVLMGERRGRAFVVDRAPDGRARVTRVEVNRVPRERGGELWAVDDVRWLATFDLPPAGAGVAPGKLRVPFAVVDDTSVRLAGKTMGVVEPRALLLDLTAGDDGAVLALKLRGEEPLLVLPFVVDVDPLAGAHASVLGDLRVGVEALPFDLAGWYADGRATASFDLGLEGLPVLDLVGGRVEGVVDVGDGYLADALKGELGYGARPESGFARFVDDDEAPLFADRSTSGAMNPAALPLTVRWAGDAGGAGIGSGRTGLGDGEVGRLDRAITGPYVALEQDFGFFGVSARGGADASTIPFVVGSFATPMHAELLGTGGAVYRLPQRDVVTGSERLWVEVRDPLTGSVRHRRALERGRDYDVDYPSGLVVLATPLGREGAPTTGTLAAQGLAFETRIVADYLASSSEARPGGSYGGRVAARALGVEVGLRGGGDSGAGYLLGGVDVDAELAPWLSLSASAARSSGDPLSRQDDFLVSRDGGASFASTTSPEARARGGDAYALRARVGDEGAHALLWASAKGGGFRDGAHALAEDSFDVGGEGTTTIVGSRVSLLGGWRRAPVEKGLLEGARRAEVRTAAARVEQPIGDVVTAAVEGHVRSAAVEGGALEGEGSAAGAGLEVAWHARRDLDLIAAHLQGLYSTGEGPGARDLTFTSVGARYHDDEAAIEGRVGVRPDGEVAGSARYSRADDDGGESYGSFGLSPDDVFTARGVSSVSGARQAAGKGTAVFVESRLIDDPLFGLSAGHALGGDVEEGPLRVALAWERSRRFYDDDDGWEGAHGSVGFHRPYLDARAFGEVRRDVALGSVVQWYGGGSGRLDVMRDLSLGGRFVLGRPGPDERALALMRAGFAWRMPSWPVVVGSYALRQELPGHEDALDPRAREHIALASADVSPWIPFFTTVLALRGRVTEVLDDDRALATQAGVLAARVGLPLFGWVEPAVEVGGRVVAGAELGIETDVTARTELALLLGPVRIGGGFVVAGFTGSGLEEVSLDPPSRAYLVFQGAL